MVVVLSACRSAGTTARCYGRQGGASLTRVFGHGGTHRWIAVWLEARDGSSTQDRGMALVKQPRPHGNSAGGNWQVTRQQAAMLQRMLRDFQV